MTVLRFAKWEGLGNDFLLVAGPLDLDDAAVRLLCDRHRGVGADGVISVEDLGPGRARMIVRNADGSRPEMCGNGLRCVAAELTARAGGESGSYAVVTDAGEKSCAVRRLGEGRYEVTAEMGTARREEDLIVRDGGRDLRFHRMNVGNPHAISFESLTLDDATFERLGAVVANAPPGGTNVEFCGIIAASPEVRIGVDVWERGVGRTLACGTAACAVAALACEIEIARFGATVHVELPGGELQVIVAEASRSVTLRGPACRAFSGEVVLA
jgi:diaminopimelate epimerase